MWQILSLRCGSSERINRRTGGCTRTSAPRFILNATEFLYAGFAARARCRRSVILVVRPNGMTRRTRITLVTAATILSGVAAYFWALRPLGFASYLSSTGATDADIIDSTGHIA